MLPYKPNINFLIGIIAVFNKTKLKNRIKKEKYNVLA